MLRAIEEEREAVQELCRRFRARRLELFGSATGDRFDSASSDLDFLVEFADLREGEYFDSYFGLMEGLRDLFHRNVDLVVESAVKNPYFRASINRSRTLLYAA